MNTVITRTRWTNKEIKLAKETLKLTYGNQKRAATILTNQLDRSLISIQVRLCSLAKKHPSLRKKNIARRIAKNVKTEKVVDIKEFVLQGNKLIIKF